VNGRVSRRCGFVVQLSIRCATCCILASKAHAMTTTNLVGLLFQYFWHFFDTFMIIEVNILRWQ